MNTFFTKSNQIQNIIKSFNLTKSLFVSSIIIGEANIGKKTLAKYIFPNAPIVSGDDQGLVEEMLKTYDELIITDFQNLTNYTNLNFDNKRVIATANYISNPQRVDDMFAFIYNMPPLRERKDDTKYLKNIFIENSISLLMIEKNIINFTKLDLDLSNNSKSLQKSIFLYILKYSLTQDEIESIIYNYISTNLEGNDGYREYLGIYEKPLIKAGLDKFGSQLKLSNILGINRNTLRKKIYEHNID